MSDVLLIDNPRRKRKAARRRRASAPAPKRRHRRARRARNPVMLSMANPRHRRKHRKARRYSRNPMKLGGLFPVSIPEMLGAGAGAVGARMIPDLLPMTKARNHGPVGWLMNLATGAVLAMAAKRFGARKFAGPIMLGAVALTTVRALGETMMKSAGVAGFVDTGTDGDYVNVGLGYDGIDGGSEQSGFSAAGPAFDSPEDVFVERVGGDFYSGQEVGFARG